MKAMVSNFARFTISFLLALLCSVLPQTVRAAEEYCATRYMPGQETACFKTKAEAEQYIRTEPATPIGNAMLELEEERQLGPGQLYWTYRVKRAAPTFYGDYYRAQLLGKGRGCGEDTPGVTAPDGTTWCDDEDKLAEDIKKSKFFYEGVQVIGGSYAGRYDLGDPGGWDVYYNGFLYQPRDLRNHPEVRVYNVVTETISHQWGVQRHDWFKCPVLFQGMYPNPGVQWPLVCYNGARGEILHKSGQYDSCCKDGNPAVAATGNKEYRESDFEWEGASFERAYNSINDLGLLSGMSDSWAHSYSARLVMHNGSPNTWILSNGYMENPTWNSATSSYGSSNRVGVMMVKEPDEVAAVRGRWRVSTSSREILWFNDGGRLVAFDRSGRIFTAEYCSSAEMQAGTCSSETQLRRIRSPSGRVLNFDYASGRIVRISADGVTQAEYAYDERGRLTHASKGGTGEGVEYLYAEPNLVCRSADDVAIVGCDAGNYPNHLTGVIDENGQRYATYRYDDYGRVTASEHAGGTGKVTWTYDGPNSVVAKLPLGTKKVYTFSSEAFRQPTGISQVTTDGSVAGSSSAFYSNFRRQWSYDARGFKAEYVYDHFNEISRKEAIANDGVNTAETRTIQTDWHSAYPFPAERRVLNNSNVLVAKTRWTYNDRGQLLTTTQVDPDTSEERISSASYCEANDVAAGVCPVLGLLKSSDGSRTDVADVTTYSYYAADEASCAIPLGTCAYRKGDLWKVTNALGQASEYLRYDHVGRALSSKDANGIVTDIEYTPRGWLAARKVRGPDPNSETDDAITRYEYDLVGQVKKVIQPDGSYVRYEYDAAHRLTDIYDMAGNRIHYTLDAAGNRLKEDTTDANGTLKRTLSRIYNQLGQLKTAKTAEGHPTGYTYDADGNGDVVTDALGRKTDSDYDPLGRLAKTLQDVGGINAKTEFKYDAQDRLVRVTDPKNLNTDYGYNGFGDQVRLTSPDTGVSTFTYDSAGNRKTATDARGITQTYSYDALNRITGIVYPTTSLNVSYSYDAVPSVCAADETFAKARLSLMTDASGSTQYCYDRFGRTTRKVQTTNGKVFVVRYAYTLAGQLSGITYPDGAVATYQRDGQGRITRIDTQRAAPGAAPEVLLSQATYHPFGPIAGWVYGNGRTMSRAVDLDYRVTVVNDPAVGGLSFGLGYDAVGNISKLMPADSNNAVLTYDYDALNRLTHTRDGPTQVAIDSYTYDATGNRLSFTNSAGTQNYIYSEGNHRMLGIEGGRTQSYDASGNSIQIDDKNFIYNDLGRGGELKKNATLVQGYVHNGHGEQVRKYTASSDRYTVYDNAGQWLGEYDGSGGALQQIVWIDDFPVALWAGGEAAQVLNYIEVDHIGTPRSVVDPSQNRAVWEWDLKGEVFGSGLPRQDADLDGMDFIFNARFPGQLYDEISGINYNYYRGYDSAVGRYVEADPIGLKGGVSLYGYVYSSPLRYFDSDGRAVRVPLSCDKLTYAYFRYVINETCEKNTTTGPKKCKAGDGCIRHLINASRFSQCAQARMEMQTTCYGGTPIYANAILNALQGERNCRMLADAECAKCDAQTLNSAAKSTAMAAAAVGALAAAIILGN